MERNNKMNELSRITPELSFSKEDKKKCAGELTMANKKLVLQRKEHSRHSQELLIARKNILFQDTEKRRRRSTVAGDGKVVLLQNNGKENQAAKLHMAMVELKASEKRYSDLFHLSPMPRWVYEPKTSRFLHVNQAAIDTYGYSGQEFHAMRIDRLGQDKSNMGKKKFVKSAAACVTVPECRQRHYSKSGIAIEMELYSNPIFINDIQYISVAAIDITEKLLNDYKIKQAIVKTQEDDLYGIGAELHDNICQILASSLMSFRLLKKSLKPSGMEMFKRTQENILLASAEIRNLSHSLAPAFFADSNVQEAFERVLAEFNSSNHFKISLNFGQSVSKAKINMDLQLTLYRILQEQLSNILKHAKATSISVTVSIAHRKLIMQVTDNGIGFTSKDAMNGIGISNMKRRAGLFLGKLTIHSAPGKGCDVIATIPLNKHNPVN